MRPQGSTIELSEPEPGTYVAKATRDDGQVALVESTESIYEASAYALAPVTADIMRRRGRREPPPCTAPTTRGRTRRKSDPVLRAVINVLCAHTDVSYYCVDWRGALFGPTCRSEEHHVERGLIQDPDAICGSQSLPYIEGGGGYVERFAASLAAIAAQTGKSISDTIRDELRDDYDRECEARLARQPAVTPRRPRGTAPDDDLRAAARGRALDARDLRRDRRRGRPPARHPGGHGDRRARRPARPVRRRMSPTAGIAASCTPKAPRHRRRPHDRAERDERRRASASTAWRSCAAASASRASSRSSAPAAAASARGTTHCLDLATGEEFTVSSTDPDIEATRIARHRAARRAARSVATRRRGPPDPSRLQRQPRGRTVGPAAAAPPRAQRRQRPRPSEPVRMSAGAPRRPHALSTTNAVGP